MQFPRLCTYYGSSDGRTARQNTAAVFNYALLFCVWPGGGRGAPLGCQFLDWRAQTDRNCGDQQQIIAEWVRFEPCRQCWDSPTWTLCWSVTTRWGGEGDLDTVRSSVPAGVTDSEMSRGGTKIISRPRLMWDARGGGITVWWTIRRTRRRITTTRRMTKTGGTSRDRSPSTDSRTGWRCRDKKYLMNDCKLL